MISRTDEAIVFGVSVRGPNHAKARCKNQDAWLSFRSRSVVAAVVCDGLGSRSESATGSRVACRAASDAFRIWVKTPNAPVSYLPKLIKLIWELRLTGKNVDDYATTCLLAGLTCSGRLIIAGLGDGIALVRGKDGSISQVIGRDLNFSNQTVALGVPHQLIDWKTFEMDNVLPGTNVLLATDGISDDLISDKHSQFLEWIEKEFVYMDPIERRKKLRNTLLDWPTPLHQDDKTLAVIAIRR